LITGHNGLEISPDGVLLSRKGQEKEEVKATVTSSESSNQPGTKSIRSTQNRPAAPEQADALPAAAGPANAEAGNGSSANQPAPEAKNGEPKKKDKKDKDSKNKKEKKDSPGVSK
jgi:hypothetical protein